MAELTWAAVFLAGLLGSTHCAGMCGGIATALGSAAGSPRRGWQPLLYHLGRIASYATAGAIAGALGTAAGFAFDQSRWSAVLRLATAAMVIVIGLDIACGTVSRARWLRAPERWGARLWRRIAPAARHLLPDSGAPRALALGLLWGWLPCGLVYSALLAAAVAGGALRGALAMLAFGLGTLPTMASLSYLGARLPRRDGLPARLLGAALVACGLWTAVVPLAVLRDPHAQPHQHGAPTVSAVTTPGAVRASR